MLLKRSLSKKSAPKIWWQQWVKPWQQTDWLLLSLPIAITLFGGIMIKSTELNQGLTEWRWHWVMGGIGTAIALISVN